MTQPTAPLAFCCLLLALFCFLPPSLPAGAQSTTPGLADPKAQSAANQPPQDTSVQNAPSGTQEPQAQTNTGTAPDAQSPSAGQDATAAQASTQNTGQQSDQNQFSPNDTGSTPSYNVQNAPSGQIDAAKPPAATQEQQGTHEAPNSQSGSRSMDGGNIAQQISTCMDLGKTDGASMEELKQVLLQKLRRNAVDVLFGKVYYQQKTGLDKKSYAGGYVDKVADQLEFQTQPEFYNGKQFGELCARAWVSMPARRVPTISPRVVRLDNFCYQADPGQSRETLRKLATTAAVDRVLENIAPGSLVPLQYRQQIEDGATINGDLRKLDEKTYCLSISINVIPLQVNLLEGKNKKKKEAPAITEPKPEFSLDLKASKEGDLVTEFGKNIAVFQDIEGKSLGSNVHAGATAEIKLNSHKNFKALVYIKKDIPFDFLHSEDLLLFTLHYKNGKYEPYSFNLTLTDDNQPMAYFRSWSYSTETFPWANAANFNEYKVEKKDGLIVFFYNGKFMYNFPSEGDELIQMKIPLRWNDRFYNVLIFDEDSTPGDGKQ